MINYLVRNMGFPHLGLLAEGVVLGVELVQLALDLGWGQGTALVAYTVNHAQVRRDVLATGLKLNKQKFYRYSQMQSDNKLWGLFLQDKIIQSKPTIP